MVESCYWMSVAAQEALWGLYASVHSLFICVFLKGENPHGETESCSFSLLHFIPSNTFTLTTIHIQNLQ